jgi:hypothetical protein
MYVKSNGKVGIGTDAPSVPLHISGKNTSGYTAVIDNRDAHSSGLFIKTGYGSVNPTILGLESVDGYKVMYVKSNGKVGIGTENPQSKLEIYNGDITLKAPANDAGDLIFAKQDGTQLGRIWTQTAGMSGLFLSSGDNNADLFVNQDGNVTVGLSQTSNLLVNGSVSTHDIVNISTDNDNVLTFQNSDNSWQYISFYTNSTRKTWMGIDPNNNFNISKENGGNILFNGANVGIGCDNPSAKLHVNNGADSDASIPATSSENNKLVVSSGSTQPAYCSTFKITQNYNGDRRNGYMSFNRGGSTDGGFLILGTNGQDRVTIDTYGNVGIGKTNPTEKLDVNGNIACDNLWVKNEIMVQLTDPWPDYVFSEEYKLIPLKELEQFIFTNKHLPGISPASKIENDGLKLVETNAKLLEKIEELTLYIFQLNKRIEGLESTKIK